MLSTFAAVKVALEICNKPEIKREILCTSGSDYDVNKSEKPHVRIKQWNKIVETKAAMIVENLEIPKDIQDKVIGVILLISLRMLTWAKYHEESLGFSRDLSFEIFNSSIFTPGGIIDLKKAAERLMYDNSLSMKQKYKLALMYCLNEHIPNLYLHMSQNDEGEFYDSEYPSRIRQPPFVKFWSYYLMGERDRISIDTNPDLYWLQMAIKSGSKDAVEYCLQSINKDKNLDDVIYSIAALEAIKNRIKSNFNSTIFSDKSYDESKTETWIPNNYYTDLMHFVFLKMTRDQQIEFLKEDIKGVHYEVPLDNYMHSRVLEFVLDWPYQDYFMKIARLMWEFLPERSYAKLLLCIVKKIKSLKSKLNYGEEKHFNYRKLFREFWNESPERNKLYVVRDNEIVNENGGKSILSMGKVILNKLFRLKNFTYYDWKNIELILGSATTEDKEKMISSKKGKEMCMYLMKNRRWNTLNAFVLNCFESKYQVEKFKKWFSCTEKVRRICINFMHKDWNADQIDVANRFINWSLSSEEEVWQYKKDLAKKEGSRVCSGLISRFSLEDIYDEENDSFAYRRFNFMGDQWENVEKFLTWCFSSEEEICDFKRGLLTKKSDEIGSLDDSGFCVDVHHNLIIVNNWGSAEIFFAWLGLTFEEIKKLKKETALSSWFMYRINCFLNDSLHGIALNYAGGKWEAIELLLRWCLTDKEAVLEFKNRFDEIYGFKQYENSMEKLSEHKRTNLNDLYVLVEELLNDLSQKSDETERKFEVYTEEFLNKFM